MTCMAFLRSWILPSHYRTLLSVSRKRSRSSSSQRLQERQQLVFLRVGECVVFLRHLRGLPGMTLDGLLFGHRQAIVHQAVARSERPQRSRSHLICCGRIFRQWQDRYAVAGSDIVQQEIAIRMNDLVTERLWNGELAAIDFRSCPRRGDRGRVADRAADFVKQCFARGNVSGYL